MRRTRSENRRTFLFLRPSHLTVSCDHFHKFQLTLFGRPTHGTQHLVTLGLAVRILTPIYSLYSLQIAVHTHIYTHDVLFPRFWIHKPGASKLFWTSTAWTNVKKALKKSTQKLITIQNYPLYNCKTITFVRNLLICSIFENLWKSLKTMRAVFGTRLYR